jgi:hypothetical protein
MATWIIDANNNRCSIEHWGSREDAQRALDSLKNCSRCSRCSDCSRCSRCSDCSDCSGCSGCSRCSDLKLKSNVRVTETGGTNGRPPPVPVIRNIHKAIYAAASAPNALEMKDVHKCENTHCRGGWAIALAGEAGYALERFYNWELAAMLIYDASDPNYRINPTRFYDSNEDALADMKRLADEEVAASST